MLYAFELSGEHPTIPRSEVLACLSLEDLDYEQVHCFDQCLLLDIRGKSDTIEATLVSVAGRLAMSHSILKVIGVCTNDVNEIINMAEEADIHQHISSDMSYAVRARKIRNHARLHGEYLEKKVGGAIYRKGYRANLKMPHIMFRLLISNKCVFGSVVASIDRSAYEKRAPHKKPFFYPGVLMPRTARALVNMSGIVPGKNILDPFCGTGGILVEAAMIGSHVIGMDAQSKIISGARMNLNYYNLDHSLLTGDATRIPLVDECMDAIVTDPPYGRSALIHARSLNNLYSESMKEMYRVLRPGSLAVVVSEKQIDEHSIKAGFKIYEKHNQFVHRSLTRTILVLEK